MDTVASNTVSPVDALWTLIQGQSKSVQKIIKSRLDARFPSDVAETPQQKYVRTTLTKALSDTKKAQSKGKQMPSAFDLLDEL